MKECWYCGDEIKTSRQKFCSDKCQRDYSTARAVGQRERELEKQRILLLLNEWRSKGFELQNAIENIKANVHRAKYAKIDP